MAPLAGEGYQQLLRALQLMEAERSRQSSLVERLQERLSRSQEETSTLQSAMAQRASHYQSLHSELLDRVSHTTDKEKEVRFQVLSVILFIISLMYFTVSRPVLY